MKTLIALITALCVISFAGADGPPSIPPGIPATTQLEGKTLVLNGVGIRKATIFRVKVYNGALYLEKKSSDPEAILNSPELKVIDLHFIRDASKSQISDAWKEALEQRCGDHCKEAAPMVDQLLSMMSAMKQGEIMSFHFYPDHVAVLMRGQQVGVVQGAIFARIVLSTWLGPKPPQQDLQDGMLGR
jgi:hypothetical protein